MKSRQKAALSYGARREVLAQIASRYQQVTGAQKTLLLDTFVEWTGYTRKYAIALLNHGELGQQSIQRRRLPQYGPAVQQALFLAWKATHYVCAKRLLPSLPRLVTLLEGLVGRQVTTETRVAKIDERTAHLTPQHAHDVREMVDRIVQELDRRSPGRPLTYAQVYAQVYGRLRRHFRVAKYDHVSDERFEEVKAWLQEEWRRVRGGTLPEQENLL